jgi:hypothetical protein
MKNQAALLLTINETKKSRLRIKNTTFTVRANGGAPSGQSCPMRTIQLSKIRLAIAIRVALELGFIDHA